MECFFPLSTFLDGQLSIHRTTWVECLCMRGWALGTQGRRGPALAQLILVREPDRLILVREPDR